MRTLVMMLVVMLAVSGCREEKEEDFVYDDRVVFKTNPYPYDAKELCILAIGNSFSQDATEWYLHRLVTEDRLDSLVTLYEASMGGASFDTWIDAYRSNQCIELHRKAGGIPMKDRGTLREMLCQSWDVVVIQQSSALSYQWNSFRHLLDLLQVITSNVTNPKVCIAYQLVWSHTPEEMPQLLEGNIDCCRKMMHMFGIDVIIPSGTAIQQARQTRLNDSMYLTRDRWHLGLGMGRYIANCTWYETLIAPVFKTTMMDTRVMPDGQYTEEDALLARQCVAKALKNRFEWQK